MGRNWGGLCGVEHGTHRWKPLKRWDVGSRASIFAGGWMECSDGVIWGESGFFVTVFGCGEVV
ncbi:hypothetical protein [Culturomica sp.]|uniref:hypothetical protein n=1 Tax=Culturomica sp. TaxID=1926652 RepID=UPI00257E60BA|nr:hypothetical protein [Culturomica sp.]